MNYLAYTVLKVVAKILWKADAELVGFLSVRLGSLQTPNFSRSTAQPLFIHSASRRVKFDGKGFITPGIYNSSIDPFGFFSFRSYLPFKSQHKMWICTVIRAKPVKQKKKKKKIIDTLGKFILRYQGCYNKKIKCVIRFWLGGGPQRVSK